MNFNTGNTEDRLRFKSEIRHIGKLKENQWETIVRS
jgi:hypothetical protein